MLRPQPSSGLSAERPGAPAGDAALPEATRSAPSGNLGPQTTDAACSGPRVPTPASPQLGARA